jgi:hypothetical protein
MLKKIALGVLLTGLVAVLIWGAVIRTNAVNGAGAAETGRRGQVTAQAATVENGQGSGGRWSETPQSTDGRGLWDQGGVEAQAPGRQGNGTLNDIPQADVQPAEWLTIQGNVVSVADDLVEIKTTAGEVIPFEGRPLSYALEQGFSLEIKDTVTLEGFDEDGEFKIGKVTRLSDNSSVMLRDVNERPGWAGRGRQG